MTLYIDVTETGRSGLNTGIQRVVRCLAPRILGGVPLGQLVIHEYGHLYTVPRIPSGGPAARPSLRKHGKEYWSRFRWNLGRFLPSEIVRGFLMAPREFFGLNWILCRPAVWLRLLRRRFDGQLRREEIEVVPGAGDVLLLLDSTWGGGLSKTAARYRARGCRVVVVFYDLIPLQHPELCDDVFAWNFRNWFARISEVADGFVCISETVARDLRVQLNGSRKRDSVPVEFFRLGSELSLTRHAEQVRADLGAFFVGHPFVFLMVGNLEPRKNHRMVLDVFEQMWRAGSPVKLLIVGRIGWKCADLLERIRALAGANDRLLLVNDASDCDLAYCYDGAAALIFPSIAEGFGLPIVEALQRGLSVLASDIPIHREVGGEAVRYFPLTAPDRLEALIADVVAAPSHETTASRSWLTWDESAELFLRALARVCGVPEGGGAR